MSDSIVRSLIDNLAITEHDVSQKAVAFAMDSDRKALPETGKLRGIRSIEFTGDTSDSLGLE